MPLIFYEEEFKTIVSLREDKGGTKYPNGVLSYMVSRDAARKSYNYFIYNSSSLTDRLEFTHLGKGTLPIYTHYCSLYESAKVEENRLIISDPIDVLHFYLTNNDRCF